MVFTDRSLNHMSKRFVLVMQDLVEVLRTTYRAETVAVVPGGGTHGACRSSASARARYTVVSAGMDPASKIWDQR